MTKQTENYSAFDKPEIILYLFHPRKEVKSGALPSNATELAIPVEKNIQVGGRFYTADKTAPNILFFHGNGEIVADYEDLAPLFNQMGINFIPVDYRGYGISTGNPSITAMMNDCHVIFSYVKKYVMDNGYSGPFIIMGRSLGSASALELAYHYPDGIDGIIIESGFAFAVPLLRLLGVNVEAFNLKEKGGFLNIDKISSFNKPTLIIHSQFDHIIPFSDGKALFQASPAKEKIFLMIPDADHNTIFMYGLKEYLLAVKQLITKIKK